MTIYAKMISDSVSAESSIRISSIEVRFPRIILAEWNTHRKFSKNTSSSRAIPIKKLISDIRKDMFIPSYWGKNQSGMQAKEELTGMKKWLAKSIWIGAGHMACNTALLMNWIGLHKQLANRIVEPWAYVTVIVTSTHWANFLALRDHPDAQPEIKELAKKIKDALKFSAPKLVSHGEWHLPYVTNEELVSGISVEKLIRISVARSASVSYRTVDGKFMTTERALALYDKLLASVPLHASPAEHQATPDHKDYLKVIGEVDEFSMYEWEKPEQHGNFTGWIQYRKTLENEYVKDKFE